MNSGSVFAAVLIAINVITLMFIAPLNNLILAHSYEPVCLSCLCGIYGGGILVVGFSLFLANFLSLRNLRGWDTRRGLFPVFGELVGR